MTAASHVYTLYARKRARTELLSSDGLTDTSVRSAELLQMSIAAQAGLAVSALSSSMCLCVYVYLSRANATRSKFRRGSHVGLRRLVSAYVACLASQGTGEFLLLAFIREKIRKQRRARAWEVLVAGPAISRLFQSKQADAFQRALKREAPQTLPWSLPIYRIMRCRKLFYCIHDRVRKREREREREREKEREI